MCILFLVHVLTNGWDEECDLWLESKRKKKKKNNRGIKDQNHNTDSNSPTRYPMAAPARQSGARCISSTHFSSTGNTFNMRPYNIQDNNFSLVYQMKKKKKSIEGLFK